MSTAKNQPQLSIAAAVQQEIFAEAIRAFPNEAVGFVAGKGVRADRLFPLRNIAAGRAFLADPLSQFRAEREIERRGLKIVAIYHSHPDGCSCASPADLLFASAWDCVHLIVALNSRDPSDPLIGAYRMVEGKPVKVPLSNE